MEEGERQESGSRFQTMQPEACILQGTLWSGSSENKCSKDSKEAAAWMFNVVTSVGIIMVNKALMATHRFSFGKPLARQQANISRTPSTIFAEGMLLGEKYAR